MTKDNWIKALARQFIGDINPETYELLEDFISQVEKDAYKRGKNEADEWWSNKDDEEYEKAEEAHRIAEGYCCACGYDMAVMEGKIKDAIEKRTKLLEDSFKHRTKPVVNLDDEDKNCEVCGYDHEYMVEDNENAYRVAHLKVELSQAIEKTNKRREESYLRGVISGLAQASKSGLCGEMSMTPGLTIKQVIEIQEKKLSDLLENKERA